MSPEELENEELGEDLITLIDEEGKETEFVIVAGVEYNGAEYLGLTPAYENGQEALEDSGALVIMRISSETDEDGQEYLDAVEDEAELEAVYQLMEEQLADDYDFDEDEEETDGE